jgi:16S rRNA (uracil1498-N3)-methyltransferase
MRALYFKGASLDSNDFIVNEEKFHHLKNVVRVKEGDEILLLDGVGNKKMTQVSKINKKDLMLTSVSPVENCESSHKNTIAFGLVKKDALEISLRTCVELAFRNIIILNTEFSQNYKVKEERLEKILESALEQSNCPFYPSVEFKNIKDLEFSKFDQIVLASMNNDKHKKKLNLSNNLILIGPEGGFSKAEVNLIEKQDNCAQLHIGGAILRTPTAIAAIAGHILASNN